MPLGNDLTRRVLEIGGLTASIDHDLYSNGLKLDNVIRSSVGASSRTDLAVLQASGGSTLELDESQNVDECLAAGGYPDEDYSGVNSCPLFFGGALLGKQYYTHASELSFAASASYSIIFSSHNLEHLPNPLKALFEWDRVLAPGGHMILILPWPDRTYDSPRERHNMLHFIQDYLDPSDARLLDFHYEAILRGSDFENIDPADPERGRRGFVKSLTEARDALKPNWEDDSHWHVFTFGLLEEIFFCLGYGILSFDLMHPYHMMAVAKKR